MLNPIRQQCRPHATQKRILAVAVLVLAIGLISGARASAAKEVAALTKDGIVLVSKEVKDKDDESLRRSTAVTLNYCRASFYRIQKRPTLRVLIEEQEKILNNIDLNGIADQDVVKLYTSVLVEISEVRLADRERGVIGEHYQTALGTVLTGDAFDFGAQLASGHYVSAVRTGARSWWDYRNVATTRDTDVFHVDQKRLMTFTEKTGQFLDTFWKLARERKIPDRWLIRNQDLNRLDAAMQERDLRVRLRILKRMENFMSCYPPFWYYVGRTQQGLGLLPAAACTYERLSQMGIGHFRKDEMLAAGLANAALIQEFLHQPGAVDTAMRALNYSTDVWEANLMCAQVLGRNGRTAEAEDAILRNLDVGLEREQSACALVSLYTMTGNASKLCSRLANPAIACRVPMPALVRAAAQLGPTRIPDAVVAQWTSSMAAQFELKFGADDFVLDTAPQWNLQASELSLVLGNEVFRQSTIAFLPGKSEIRFAGIGELGHPLNSGANAPPAVLVIKFPNAPILRLTFDSRSETAGNSTSSSLPVVDMLTSGSFSSRRHNLVLASVQIGNATFPVTYRAHPALIPESDADAPTFGITIDHPAASSASDEPKQSKAQASIPPPPIPMLSPPRFPSPSPSADGPKLFP
jgi:hypothetical protein